MCCVSSAWELFVFILGSIIDSSIGLTTRFAPIMLTWLIWKASEVGYRFCSTVIVVICCCFLWVPQAVADAQVRVGVASNFITTARALSHEFTQETGIQVSLSAASTGKLYAQIRNGLPIDVFLAADEVRPALLVEEGLADGASRFPYAIGELALWVPGVEGGAGACESWLRSASDGRFAVANPRTAPYGEAARQVLEKMALIEQYRSRLVQGENIGQTFLFVDTSAAQGGFVARSQLIAKQKKSGVITGCVWRPDQEYYTAIRQDAVILTTAVDNSEAYTFVDWLQSEQARNLIQAHGYRLP